MRHSGDRFSGAGGVEIYRQSWLPDSGPRASVAISHGVSEHSDRYAHVADRLVRTGYAVHALDHRGHGNSGGRRALIDRLDNAVADLRTLLAAARELHPGRPLFLLGHSMGGGISLEYALRHQEEIDGLVLSAPTAAVESASPPERAAARILSAVAPGLGVYGVDASAISRDPEVVRAYVEDPRVYHRRLPARTVAELVAAIDTFADRMPTLRLPLLVMLGTDDTLVPPAAGRMVSERASSADKTLVEYDGLYHEILNEPEQGRVLDELVAWLAAHAPIADNQPARER